MAGDRRAPRAVGQGCGRCLIFGGLQPSLEDLKSCISRLISQVAQVFCHGFHGKIEYEDLLTPRKHECQQGQLRELWFEKIDDFLRIRAQGRITDDAELNPSSVAQDGDAQAH